MWGSFNENVVGRLLRLLRDIDSIGVIYKIMFGMLCVVLQGKTLLHLISISLDCVQRVLNIKTVHKESALW